MGQSQHTYPWGAISPSTASLCSPPVYVFSNSHPTNLICPGRRFSSSYVKHTHEGCGHSITLKAISIVFLNYFIAAALFYHKERLECSSIYLYDCRFRNEGVGLHHFHHSLCHHSRLHARHIEAIHILPECNSVPMSLCVSKCCQADVTEIWIH